MPQAALISEIGFSGSMTSPEVTVPADRKGTATLILSASASPLNVFDLTVDLEVFENGEWRVVDHNFFPRDLVTGPLDSININITTRVERWAGQRGRVQIAVGQCVLSVSAVVKW